LKRIIISAAVIAAACSALPPARSGEALGIPLDAALGSCVSHNGYEGQMTMQEFMRLPYEDKHLFLIAMQEGWDTGVSVVVCFDYGKQWSRDSFSKRAYLLRGWKMTPLSFQLEAVKKLDAGDARLWRCALILAEARFARNAGQEERAHALVEAAKKIDKVCVQQEDTVVCITSRKDLATLRKQGKLGLMTRGFLDGIALARGTVECEVFPTLGYSYASTIESMEGLYSRGVARDDTPVWFARLLATSELVNRSTVE